MPNRSQLTQLKKIEKLEHFGDLSKDTTGNSRCVDKWENLISIDCDYYPECDIDIKWTDSTGTLAETPNNKAPGADGVPSEVWKLVMDEPSPKSNFSKLIFKIINMMRDSGEVPKCQETSIVVPISKKFRLMDPDNYRGISLLPTLSKIMAKIVASKLTRIEKKYKLLVKEQAGFRNLEECAGKATSLYEIIHYSKAYDYIYIFPCFTSYEP
ncbi:RNA-directed DNA polymerase from mobile element jockey [Smittium culicis]|uniref:RNA-directed DNA polymerase from mobile element jockey n=1 Tax=Smittium culicis TaxID=133412 RepID=A0A1R1YMT5_9FUNG|nr:RNA-directed DNA polymerase from mobile element jockey [Smittium culicis]